MISFHTRALFYVDPAWTRLNILPLADLQDEEGIAFWDGFTWQAQAPQKTLFPLMKKSLITQAVVPRERRNQGNILTGMVLSGWGGNAKRKRPNGPIRSAQFRESLIVSGEEMARQVLWYLRQWSQDHQVKWRDYVAVFFKEVWPRQRIFRTPETSAKIAGLAFEMGDKLPELCPLILPHLVPINGQSLDSLVLHSKKDSAVNFYPKECLDILWVILGEDPTLWPYGIDQALATLADKPETKGDPRLSELRRRRGL